MDPPYKEKCSSLILDRIIKSNVLNIGGIIIIHTHKKEEDKFPENFKILEKKNLWYLKNNFWKLFLK